MTILVLDPSLSNTGTVVFKQLPSRAYQIVHHSVCSTSTCEYRKSVRKKRKKDTTQPTKARRKPKKKLDKVYSGEDYLRRTDEMAKYLAKVIDMFSPDKIAFELPTGGTQSSDAANSLMISIGVLGSIKAIYQIPTLYVFPNEMKEAVTGNSHAEKEEIMDAVVKVWPGLGELYKSSRSRSGYSIYVH